MKDCGCSDDTIASDDPHSIINQLPNEDWREFAREPDWRILIPEVTARKLRGFEEHFIVTNAEHPEGQWRTALGGLAWGLYQTIRDAPEDAQAGIEEWAREFRTSKTVIRRALGELEERGFITAYVEEDTADA